VGELVQRVGLGNFLEAIGVEPVPEMIAHPRENPYIFFEEYFEVEEEEAEADGVAEDAQSQGGAS